MITICIALMVGDAILSSDCKQVEASMVPYMAELCWDDNMPDHKGDSCMYAIANRNGRRLHTFIITIGGKS